MYMQTHAAAKTSLSFRSKLRGIKPQKRLKIKYEEYALNLRLVERSVHLWYAIHIEQANYIRCMSESIGLFRKIELESGYWQYAYFIVEKCFKLIQLNSHGYTLYLRGAGTIFQSASYFSKPIPGQIRISNGNIRNLIRFIIYDINLLRVRNLFDKWGN